MLYVQYLHEAFMCVEREFVESQSAGKFHGVGGYVVETPETKCVFCNNA